jgi:hypothetical protein
VFSRRFTTFWWVSGLSLLFLISAAGQNFPTDPAAKLLPDTLGEFRASGTTEVEKQSLASHQRSSIRSAVRRVYASNDGRRFSVTLAAMPSDSAAYAEFTQNRRLVENVREEGKLADADVGTEGFSRSGSVANTYLVFFKGPTFIAVRDESNAPELKGLTDFAKSLSDTLDKGVGEIPVLVKHLPAWETQQQHVLYAINKEALQEPFSNQGVLDAVSFEGGTEAAIADYGPPKLVVVEFSNASLATDNDQRIKAKLQELTSQGLPLPTAYRRVGNYAVFVFDAPSAEAANSLIDQVKYQQVVQWLGPNPFAYEAATREFTETTLGVFVSVVQTSGLALVGCLAVGGIFGALLFRSRRAQQRAREAFADSDAMLRLNLDELTPENDPARLIGPGN